MTAQIITDPPRPGTPEWRGMITASKVPIILGLSPWQSPYRLAAEMMGLIEPEEISPQKQDMFLYGHAAELSMAYFWSKKNPEWDVSEGEVAFTNDSLAFPNLVTLDRLATHRTTGEKMILEFKTASNLDSMRKWGKPGTARSVPIHYEYQVLTQMAVSGIHRAEVLVQCMGPPETHAVQWNPLYWAKTETECVKFYSGVKSGTMPPLDSSVATYEAVRGIHPDIDTDTVMEVSLDQGLRLLEAKENSKRADANLLAVKSELLLEMGTRQRIVSNGKVIARRQKGRGKNVEFRISNLSASDLTGE